MKVTRKLQVMLATACILSINFLTACPKVRSPHCTSDTECKTDGSLGAGVCISGQCQDCSVDTDCTEGSRCHEHRCEAACSDDASCGAGFHCASGFCQRDCTSDDNCDFNMTCQNNRCSVQKNMCSTDIDCEPGYSCASGMCTNQSVVVTSDLSCKTTKVVHFAFDKSIVNSEEASVLDEVVQCLKSDAEMTFMLEGHTDSRGTTEYNLALGQRRADSTKSYLSKSGVDTKRVKTISYGKEKPSSSEENETGWAANRRVEILPGK